VTWVVVAPAMDGDMWTHPATVTNVARLRDGFGYTVVAPESGQLASGQSGVGRLAELPAIVDARGSLGPVQTLAQRHGKIVVVDFWATWCTPCLEALPKLERLARQPGIEVIAINLDAPGAAWTMFSDAHFRMTLVADDGARRVRNDDAAGVFRAVGHL